MTQDDRDQIHSALIHGLSLAKWEDDGILVAKFETALEILEKQLIEPIQ